MAREQYSSRVRLFHFTDREEFLMERAKDLSIKFMKNYGKGKKPRMVDLRYYAN